LIRDDDGVGAGIEICGHSNNAPGLADIVALASCVYGHIKVGAIAIQGEGASTDGQQSRDNIDADQ
jgi:hypothetical protein